MTDTQQRDAAALVARMEALAGAACAACGRPVAPRETVQAMVLGLAAAPRCLACLASAHGRANAEMAEHLVAYFQRRDCWWAAWEAACRREGVDPGRRNGEHDDMADLVESRAVPRHDLAWDAGDLGCGDLALELRSLLRGMLPGQVLRATARDPGAPEDIPAWCGMTGHALLHAAPPDYYIQRKED